MVGLRLRVWFGARDLLIAALTNAGVIGPAVILGAMPSAGRSYQVAVQPTNYEARTQAMNEGEGLPMPAIF